MVGLRCADPTLRVSHVGSCPGACAARLGFRLLRCALDDRHLNFRKGILFQVEKTIPLENIQDVTFIEGPLLRRFDLSILRIETAGQSPGQAHNMQLVASMRIGSAKRTCAVAKPRVARRPSPVRGEARRATTSHCRRCMRSASAWTISWRRCAIARRAERSLRACQRSTMCRTLDLSRRLRRDAGGVGGGAATCRARYEVAAARSSDGARRHVQGQGER